MVKSNKDKKGDKGGPDNRHFETGGFMTAPKIIKALAIATYDKATISKKANSGSGSSHSMGLQLKRTPIKQFVPRKSSKKK